MSARATEPPESARQPELPRTGYLLLAALTLFWGANWPGMKLALAEIPVWWFRSIWLSCGGAGLLALAWASGQRLRVPRNELRPLLICAVFNVVGWHIFSGYGVSLMPAGRASIIAFTMPLWAALLGSLVLGDRLTGRRLLGLAVGLSGLAVLIGPGRIHIGTHDVAICRLEGQADLLHECQICIPVAAIEIVKENAADAARFVTVLEPEILVTPFLVAFVVSHIMAITDAFERCMKRQ